MLKGISFNGIMCWLSSLSGPKLGESRRLSSKYIRPHKCTLFSLLQLPRRESKIHMGLNN